MKVFILSDIHGNLSAFNTLLEYIKTKIFDGIILLGDLIDYGPHSNEILSLLDDFSFPVFCNIQGNHEDAILRGHYSKFSSERGVESAQNTKLSLSEESKVYLTKKMNQCGLMNFCLDKKKCLAVHGSIYDEYWGKFSFGEDLSKYSEYDYVFTGHLHRPHFYEHYFSCENSVTRNLKKTIFINPGSVGQPRNLNPYTQFVFLDADTEFVEFIKLNYDIKNEQNCFSDNVDDFYKKRLEFGV